MPYLDPSEYEAYGLATDTTGDLVQLASSLIDAHCRRGSLLAAQYTERIRLTAGAQSVRLSYLPLAAGPLVSVRVRYGRPRRGEMQETMLTQAAWAFSIPGSWSTLDPATVDVNPATGEVTFPANLLGVPYNEVEIAYTAGFAAAPPVIKTACAQVVRNAQATPALNVKGSRVDTLQMQYFSGSLIDENVRTMLAPFVAQKVG
jgi:hypothetical protein